MTKGATKTKAERKGAGRDSIPPRPARDRLIEAAARLFAEKSFGGVSVREICKEAGTGINMVHHYFGNKEGLREAIVQQFDERVYAVPLRILANPAQSREDLEARITLVFETTLEACLEERDIMMVVIREQAELATLVAFQTALVSFLSAAKDIGLVRPELDAEMISGAMLDRIISQVQFAPWIKSSTGVDIFEDAEYRQRWCRSSVDLYLHGIIAL